MAATVEAAVTKLRVPLSNLDKVLYPAGRFTKADVIHYYFAIAPFILPHLKNRPVTLKRFPDGMTGESFYEKDAPSFTPAWVKRTPVPRRDRSLPPIQYILVNDVRTLVWLANLACLELHPFLHRAPELDRPTHIVFDLDPGEGVNILACAEVAVLLKEVLEKVRLKAFPKVSGSKGLQIYLPLNTSVTYAETQPFAKALAELLARQHPDRVVSEMAKALRRGKVFVDWSQNTDHKTTVSVYSLRAGNVHPYVSVPVTWEELTKALKKNDPEVLYWEAKEVLARVKKRGDLFAPVLKLKQTIPDEFATVVHAPEQTTPPKSLSETIAVTEE
jgi:bifunctional non-homologous end joining protein LigD